MIIIDFLTIQKVTDTSLSAIIYDTYKSTIIVEKPILG